MPKARTYSFTLFAIALLLGGSACSGNEVPKGGGPVSIHPSGRLLLQGATIVDTRTGELLSGRSVLTEGGRIVSIGPAASLAPSGPVQVVDARGKYLVPGYNDMHAHLLGHGDDPSSNLKLMLAYGVTGFRQMQGSTVLLRQRRDRSLPLTADAPALLEVPGELLSPFNAASEKQALATIAEEKAQGADFIKAGLTSGAVFRAVLVEGKKIGIPVLGHVPPDVDVLTAARMGVKSIEHLGPSPGLMVACSTDEAALMRDAPELPGFLTKLAHVPFMDRLFERILKRMIVNTVLVAGEKAIPRMQQAMKTFDEGKCRTVAAEFARLGTWHVPTLVRSRSSRLADDPTYQSNPNLKFIAPETIETWHDITDEFEKKIGPKDRQILRESYALDKRLVKILDAAGARMLAGSDVTGAGWLVPGDSLHREFDELASSGLSALRILQMTTLNPAQYLGRTQTMGSVEVGKVADLVLLDGNPVDDVRNLHRIAGVVRAGYFHSPADLEALKKQIAKAPGNN